MKLSRLAFLGAFYALTFAVPALAQPPAPVVGGYDYSGLKIHPLNVDSTGRLQVVGSAAGGSVFGNNAAGTAPTQPPVLVAGSDGTLVRTIKTDTSGNVQVVGTVTGNVASGSADSGNPVKVGGVYNATPPTFVDGQRGDLQLTQRGQLGVSLYNTAGSAVTVQSSGADGVSNTQSGLNVYARGVVFNGATWDRNYSATAAQGTTGTGVPSDGSMGVYNSTLPTVTTGQFTSLQTTASGELRTANALRTVAGADGVANNVLGAMFGATGDQLSRYLQVATMIYNGSTWDRPRTIQGADQTGLGITGVANSPNSNVNSAITPVVSSAVESGHVLKAAAGNFYRLAVTTGATSGYVLVFNATTVPADGAVTPILCRAVAPNTSIEIDHTVIPQRYSTGISVAFSSTGCFTKTASATAMFEGDVE